MTSWNKKVHSQELPFLHPKTVQHHLWWYAIPTNWDVTAEIQNNKWSLSAAQMVRSFPLVVCLSADNLLLAMSNVSFGTTIHHKIQKWSLAHRNMYCLFILLYYVCIKETPSLEGIRSEWIKEWMTWTCYTFNKKSGDISCFFIFFTSNRWEQKAWFGVIL